jgi:hypothetical protein
MIHLSLLFTGNGPGRDALREPALEEQKDDQ